MALPLDAQKKDSIIVVPRKKSNILQAAMNAVTRSHAGDTGQVILNTKAETPFIPYEGKIIRHIYIKQFGFEKTFTDTAHGIKYFGTRLLNTFHRNTRQWVIRNNLLLKEGTELNAYRAADNERYLRSLGYMQDARILVNYLPGNPDSVDLVVVTKDVFSIGGDISDIETNKQKFRITDANVLGMGQRISFGARVDQGRAPVFGYDLSYGKNNIAHTFINASFQYTTINRNRGDGSATEASWQVRFDRPLVSQYTHLTGGFAFGNSESHNLYNRPDTQFYHYRLGNIDAWLGYNIGVKKILADDKMNLHKLVSIRYMQNDFSELPFQFNGKYDTRFNDQRAILGQLTLFKQDFYKTNYIYGFGTTEDMPYGYSVSFTGGWYKQVNRPRAYAGIDANRYIVSSSGDVVQYFFRSSAFPHSHRLEDASLLLGTSMFSRLYLYNNVKIRQYVRLSYTRLFNRTTFDPLKINNPFGLRFFPSDSIAGDRRLSLHSETSFFLKYKLLGFQFAPFVYGDASLLTPERTPIKKSDLYYGIGGGVRTRNNNLVFNTFELRFIYFPRRVDNVQTFKISINSDIRFRFNNTYLRPPDIVQLNSDNGNYIY
ncbi:BamA/TamA family outer membrane protein [Deminuibacter soli]|nr:hypothetical protein [Deminuibacter soli]